MGVLPPTKKVKETATPSIAPPPVYKNVVMYDTEEPDYHEHPDWPWPSWGDSKPTGEEGDAKSPIDWGLFYFPNVAPTHDWDNDLFMQTLSRTGISLLNGTIWVSKKDQQMLRQAKQQTLQAILDKWKRPKT